MTIVDICASSTAVVEDIVRHSTLSLSSVCYTSAVAGQGSEWSAEDWTGPLVRSEVKSSLMVEVRPAWTVRIMGLNQCSQPSRPSRARLVRTAGHGVCPSCRRPSLAVTPGPASPSPNGIFRPSNAGPDCHPQRLAIICRARLSSVGHGRHPQGPKVVCRIVGPPWSPFGISHTIP
ncbi:hypothetical protein HOY82DRAFT_601536 [Tuber indicum]|nr:hypothetical protein HOY82DRAFT_601536 [Tuber indicum]